MGVNINNKKRSRKKKTKRSGGNWETIYICSLWAKRKDSWIFGGGITNQKGKFLTYFVLTSNFSYHLFLLASCCGYSFPFIFTLSKDYMYSLHKLNGSTPYICVFCSFLIYSSSVVPIKTSTDAFFLYCKHYLRLFFDLYFFFCYPTRFVSLTSEEKKVVS